MHSPKCRSALKKLTRHSNNQGHRNTTVEEEKITDYSSMRKGKPSICGNCTCDLAQSEKNIRSVQSRDRNIFYSSETGKILATEDTIPECVRRSFPSDWKSSCFLMQGNS